jgi:AraC family transcriptional regulator
LPPYRFRRVIDYIQAHLGEATSLRRLAELAGLSPYHFARLFKRSTGRAPHQYVVWQRIERAKRLLAAGSLPLVQVAFRLGFPSQAHFTTVFRKHVGTTPGAYRQARTRWGRDVDVTS